MTRLVPLASGLRRRACVFLPLASCLVPLATAQSFPHEAVVSNDPVASQVGADVMRRGGNAVDAAVAVGFALAVTWPEAGNLGGGGFMVVRTANGRSYAFDFRETAPLNATKTMYQDDNGEVVPGLSTIGHLAVGVPGTVAGLELAHKRLGRLPWQDVVEPAVLLAQEGFPVTGPLLAGARASSRRLSEFPESKRIFVEGLAGLEPGDIWRQPGLAETLKRIRDQGAKGFYEGETARRIAEEMQRNGGLIGLEDLRSYRALEVKPLTGRYRDCEIITMPPPSSGGVAILQMMTMLERFRTSSYVHNGIEYLHLLAEVMKRAFADRARYMGDPRFTEIPIDRLLSRNYLDERISNFDAQTASKAEDWGPGSELREGSNTTHYSVVDRWGNAVAVTYTLNSSYGSGVTAPGTGVLLNNEMDDFTSKAGVPNIYGLVQSEVNLPEPGKRPLSSMTPTIVVKDGKPLLVTGSPGGPRIISAVLQCILNILDFGFDPQTAVDLPRIHHQWLPDQILFEHEHRYYRTVALRLRGHQIDERRRSVGNVQLIYVDPETGTRTAAGDKRRQTGAAGS
ncbi:MAG: gamma-glutamyltransferase [Armatimonadetes bacterium]|nr:gamma-glutamyltransferase [Armatimonadota bacterium]